MAASRLRAAGTRDDLDLMRALAPLLDPGVACLEEPRLGETVCLAVADAIDAEVAFCVLGPRPRRRLLQVAGAGSWARKRVDTEWPIDLGLADEALRRREAVEIDDLSATAEPAMARLPEEGLHAARAVPLLLRDAPTGGGDALGILVVLRRRPGAFTEPERRTLDQVAAITVLHLARLKLAAAEATAVRQRHVAFEVAHDLATSLEPSVVISRLLVRLIEVVRADRGTVSWVDGDVMVTEHSHDVDGTPTPPTGQRVDYTGLPECVEAIRTARPVFAGSVDAGALPVEQSRPYRGVRRRLLLPVVIGGRVVANVALSRRRDEPFGTDDLATVAPLMNVATVALRNAMLYGESERARTLATRAVASIGRHSAAVAAMPAFLGRLSDTMAELVEAEHVAFWELDGDRLRVASEPAGEDGRSRAGLRDISCRRGGSGGADRIVFGDRMRHISAATARRARLPWVDVLGPRDALCVGWKAGDRVLGMVAALGSRRQGGFTREDGWVLGISSQSAGLVWERAEALRQLTAVRDQEEGRLRAVAERAAELEAVKTRFLRLASHELRGPIGVARGYMSMLADGSLPLTGDLEPVFAMIQAKLAQMNLLVDDMLENARLEDGRLELNLVRADLREVVHEVVEGLRPLAGARLQLVPRTPPRPITVLIDTRRIATIVSNMVDNAIKYSPSGGDVLVRVRTTGDGAAVSVEDHGMGIEPDAMPVLFTRFGRVVTRENSHIPGSGLGLHLARELARLHGGDLGVVSAPGQGTTVTLTLPLA